MKEAKNPILLDRALRRAIKAEARARVLASLPYCLMVVATYTLPSLILGIITSVPMEADWTRMLAMFGVSLACEIVILGPITLGAQYAMLGVARGRKNDMAILFSPLGDMRELLRGMRMMLCMVTRVMLLAAAPTALYLGAAFFLSRWVEGGALQNPYMVTAAVSALLFVYVLLLLPLLGRMLSYTMGYAVLYDDPDAGVWRATAESSRLLHGQRRSMTLFALSFLPWFIGGLFTCGVLSAFGSVYMVVSAYMLGDRLRAAQEGEGRAPSEDAAHG